jgi:uncharacterized membrane protein
VTQPSPATVPTGLLRLTHAIYALHTLSIVIALTGDAFIVTRFVLGMPSIIAVILNYARRREAQGTWLASHFQWQIRTFWFAALWLLASTLLLGPLVLIAIGIPLLLIAYMATGLWVSYRVLRGWLALRDGRALPLAPA